MTTKTKTHRQISREAICIQLTNNEEEVIRFCEGHNIKCEKHRGYLLMRGHVQGGIFALHKTDWVVEGEDGKIRYYWDKLFKIKYEGL